jgi:hypothetical protein
MRLKRFQQFNEELTVIKNYKCPICRGALYRTDAGGTSVTLQCSSPEARFWDFQRGSAEQKNAHDHFMKSTTYISNDEWNKIMNESPNKISTDSINTDPIVPSKVRT